MSVWPVHSSALVGVRGCHIHHEAMTKSPDNFTMSPNTAYQDALTSVVYYSVNCFHLFFICNSYKIIL